LVKRRRTAPKKSFGTKATIEMGSRKSRNSHMSTTYPHTREVVPVRKVKMVYERVKAERPAVHGRHTEQGRAGRGPERRCTSR